MKRIGFIGLGVMGGPMAQHLITKHGNVAVFDMDACKMHRFSPLDADLARSIAEAGTAADVVFLSLPGSQVVNEVVLGDGGLASTMSAGGVIVDTSTTEPAVTKGMAKALAAKGISLLDAPVSGGEKAAIEGTLSIMVGGDERVFADNLELLNTMGTAVRVGETGSGQTAKLVNNMIVGATFAIVAESFALGVKSGLDPETLYQAIRSGWAGSRVLDVAAPAMLGRNFKPGGTVNIHCKDLGYALSLAKEQDVPLPVTALVHEIFKAARAAGRGGMSQPAIVTLWESLLGVEVKSPKD